MSDFLPIFALSESHKLELSPKRITEREYIMTEKNFKTKRDIKKENKIVSEIVSMIAEGLQVADDSNKEWRILYESLETVRKYYYFGHDAQYECFANLLYKLHEEKGITYTEAVGDCYDYVRSFLYDSYDMKCGGEVIVPNNKRMLAVAREINKKLYNALSEKFCWGRKIVKIKSDYTIISEPSEAI